MSAVTVIKNIFEFAKILNTASRDDVKCWNIASIQNAISWSDYCQEIYRCVKGQEYEEDLNQQMSQITFFLHPVSCINLSVESLGKAKYLLVENLLSNPNFPMPSKSILRDIILGNKDSAWILERLENKSAKLKLSLDICVEISHLTEVTSKFWNGDGKLFDQKVLYEAFALIHHLNTIRCRTNKPERYDEQDSGPSDALPPFRPERTPSAHIPDSFIRQDRKKFKKYCQLMCDKLSESQEGRAIIVSMFCEKQDLSLTKGDEIKDVQSLILDWLKFKLNQDIINSIIWEMNADLLFQASCDNQDFFQLYLSSLILWADTFRPIINKEMKFLWRSPTGHSAEILTEHFKKFFIIQTPVMVEKKNKVLETVVEKVKSSDFTVWQVVAQILLETLK